MGGCWAVGGRRVLRWGLFKGGVVMQVASDKQEKGRGDNKIAVECCF